MQDKHGPSSPPDVRDLDSDNEIFLDGDVEEIIDLDDPIFESASSSENENENSLEENASRVENDDAVCTFRGHEKGKSAALIFVIRKTRVLWQGL